MSEPSLLSNRNFQLHCLTCIISLIGSFFTFVALPWLVLGITDNSPVIMSTVMATGSLPQAFFILFGGVLADRFSPLIILFVSRVLFVLFMASLAFMVYTEELALWMLYIYAFVLGVLGSLTLPAGQAFLPSILPPSQLPLANGLVMGSSQVAQVIGPIFAGWLIWWMKVLHGVAPDSYDHIAFSFAFAIDATAVCFAVVLMLFIHGNPVIASKEKLFFMLKQGFSFCWQDKAVTVVLSYLILVSFCLHGTLMAGLPVFTKLHLGLTERSYGNLYATMGFGTVIGVALSILFRNYIKKMGILVLFCDLLSGIGLFSLGNANTFLAAVVCLLVMGAASGVIMVAGTTWFQQRTPDFLMGRIISILMFCILGFIPVSASLTGAFMTLYPVTTIMNFAGLTIITFTLVGLTLPNVRNIGELPKIEFSS